MTETNVFQFSQPGTLADPLTEVQRNGARALLTHAVDAEVAALLSCHADKFTDDGPALKACARPVLALESNSLARYSKTPARVWVYWERGCGDDPQCH